MVEGNTMVLAIAAAYILLTVLIGEYSRRRTGSGRMEYFLGSRRFRAIALFFSIVATVLSAFAILGHPGAVYRTGVANFGFLINASTLLFPLAFGTVGYRLWIAGKEFDHITPTHFINHRFESRYTGLLLMALMVFWTIPYLVLGGIGGGIAFKTVTGGAVSYMVGVGIVIAIVFFYVMAGGMRGTTWTNMLQGLIMLVVLAGFVIYVGMDAGGFSEATSAAIREAPDLVNRAASPKFSTKGWLSGFLLALSALMYPQVFLRLLTGRDATAFRRFIVLVPIGMGAITAMSTLLGFWGIGQVPGLEGRAADQIIPALLSGGAPVYLAGATLVLLLAAVMSTFDAQVLTLSTLFSEDIIRPFTNISEAKEILTARLLVAPILVAVFVGALLRPGTIFYLAEFAFQGYTLLLYPAAVGLYWTRATAGGVAAGLIVGFTGLWLFQIGFLPEQLTLGFLPVVPLLVVQVLTVHLASHATSPPSEERIQDYFRLFEDVW